MGEWEARARREALMAAAAGAVDEERLKGTDEEARDYFLGLALRVEEEMGPRFLGEALRRCARGTAGEFVESARRLAKERDTEEVERPFRD